MPVAAPCAAETPTWALPGDRAFVAAETPPPPPPPQDDLPAWPLAARLEGPTGRYPHDVLGGIPAFTRLAVTARACGACRHGGEGGDATLSPPLVFEDAAPRLWDVDGDGRPEVVVVESHERLGARLAVWHYAEAGATLMRRAATAHIGTRFRWLAVAGHGDLDGDGRIEIAYVDRPHLARELVVVRLEGDRLVEVARAPGFSNHRIGETAIASEVRRCGGRDMLVLPDADGRRALAVRLQGGRIVARDIGARRGTGLPPGCP